MSLQWTIVAGLMYAEIAVCSLLMLPFISPSRWQQLFRSRLLAFLGTYTSLFLNIFFGVLVLLLADSIRDMVRFSAAHADGIDLAHNPMSEAMNNLKMFRAQRNFYIAGFSLFLFVVIRRLARMIVTQAQLSADRDAAKKQAESATDVARKLMEDRDPVADDNKKNESEASLTQQAEAEATISDLREALRKSQADLEAMKKQSESLSKEYDRLADEHSSLQKKFEHGDASKKDD